MAHDRTAHLGALDLELREYPGLTVRVTAPTAEAEVLAARLVPALSSRHRPTVVAAVARLARPFADSLLAWNLSVAGRTVPATRAGVVRVDADVLADVLRAWVGLWHQLRAGVAGPDAEEAFDEALLSTAETIPLVPAGDAESLPEAG